MTVKQVDVNVYDKLYCYIIIVTVKHKCVTLKAEEQQMCCWLQ